jgi:solute carrier family 45, member 1/2/4
MGYALGAINWDNTIFANFIGDNIKTVFTLVTIIFICAMLFTITSFREIPLKLLESDELLRPITQVAVKKEKERLKAIENEAKNPTASVSFEKEKSSVDFDEAPTPSYVASLNRESSTVSLSSLSDDEDDDQDESITMMMYLK